MFPSGRCPKTENPTHYLSRPFALPAFLPPHLPYYRVGPLLWTFTLKTRRLFPYPSPPCCHCSSNPAGAMGKKHRLLTFHITESDQLCNHLPSKNGMLFAGQRPPFSPLSPKNPIGLGLKRCPLTFHITDLEHFSRNLTSKIGMFFATHRPHFDAMSAVSSPPEKTSPHIPYHRVGTILWTFNLKNQHVF